MRHKLEQVRHVRLMSRSKVRKKDGHKNSNSPSVIRQVNTSSQAEEEQQNQVRR